jgi:hypothetical protein
MLMKVSRTQTRSHRLNHIAQEFEEVPLTALRPHPRNPRRGNVAAIAESIDRNGWYGAIVVQRSTGYILAGNHRYRAALQQGATSLPVCWVEVDDQRAMRILLADNRASDLARQSDEDLSVLLAELAGSEDGLLGTGYAEEDLETLLDEACAPLGEDQRDELCPGFEIVVRCEDESQQRDLLDRLQQEGFACRALVL